MQGNTTAGDPPRGGTTIDVDALPRQTIARLDNIARRTMIRRACLPADDDSFEAQMVADLEFLLARVLARPA